MTFKDPFLLEWFSGSMIVFFKDAGWLSSVN